MEARGAMAFLKRHGVVLMSARGPVPNLIEALAGGPVRGSWWAHPQARRMYRILMTVCDSEQVLTCRLVGGKITLVHRRLWPALVRLAGRIPRSGLGFVRQEHTERGSHRNLTTPFPRWVPREVMLEAARLEEPGAVALIGADLLALLERRGARPARRRGAALLVLLGLAGAWAGDPAAGFAGVAASAAEPPPAPTPASAPTPTSAPEPSVALPKELARVLTDYETAWRAGDGAALARLFDPDGFVLPSGAPPVRGRAAIARYYSGPGGPLVLRALAYATEGSTGYIIGAFARQEGQPDLGKFTLTLRRSADGWWLIKSDMDNSNRPPR